MAVEEYRRQQPKSPCYEQTREEIENYYRHAPVGSPAAVRDTRYGFLCYEIVEIEGGRRGRIFTRDHGSFYMKHGRNCYHPKGQTSLVVPTEAVVAWAKEHPSGEMGYAVYHTEGDDWLFRQHGKKRP